MRECTCAYACVLVYVHVQLHLEQITNSQVRARMLCGMCMHRHKIYGVPYYFTITYEIYAKLIIKLDQR